MPLATFDASAAFAHLSNRVFTLRELSRACAAVRVHHAEKLPAETYGRDLLELLRAKGWLFELPDGMFRVSIPPSEG